MDTKRKNIVLTVLMAAALLAGALCCLLLPDREWSVSERRLLAQRPADFFSGSFAEDFERYAQDQFPDREGFRGLKALSETYLFGKLDNNGLYLSKGHVSSLDYPLNQDMLDHAAERFRYLYDRYLSGTEGRIYLAIIPDKNYFLAQQSGRLSLDYDALVSYMRENMDYAAYIDLFPLLSLDNYYRTDSHWRQETLPDTANALLAAMGAPAAAAEYTENTLDLPFYGVYAGQSALPLAPDVIRYLTSPAMDGCTVTSYDTGAPVKKSVYDQEKARGRDPYELFLSGADALITIENPEALSDRELILFRDSFGSAIAPLLLESYAKITLVDIRYLRSDLLGSFLDFQDQDVLFLYGTTLLNNSLALR